MLFIKNLQTTPHEMLEIRTELWYNIKYRYGAAMASTGMRKLDKRAADESAALTRLKILKINANDYELAYAA